MDTNARVTAVGIAERRSPWFWLACGIVALGAALALRPAAAQEVQTLELATAEELHEIVGPIALYPDDLVAIVLPASTYPLQVVQAARFLDRRANDSSLKPEDEWDDSIVALLNYPEVVELLNDDLDWTYDLGTAVLNQRADVLNAIQDFREEAYAAGNLRTDERQTVARDDGAIEITSADPQVIYVPYYEPERVVVYQPVPVYHYYPRRYPVYYYPYPAHYVFDTGFFWGVSSWYSIGWHNHYVHLYDPFYYGHPYFGRTYYDPFYFHRNVIVNVNVNRDRDYIWRPQQRYGGRPVVRGNEGRVYTSDRAPRRGVLDSNATRTREGSVSRGTESTPTVSAATQGAAQPRRGVTSSTYRNRSVASTERATQAAQASRPARATIESGATAPPRAPSVARNPAVVSRPAPTSQGTYRSGGGMSQALERNRATAPSTGMPREAARSAPPVQREAAPVQRAPNDGGGGGGGASRQRSDDGGGSYRGGGGGGGSSQRSEHPAARGGEGRSAGR